MSRPKPSTYRTTNFQTLRQDKDLQTDLAGQDKAFKEHLIHDISLEDFADIYAETIAYRQLQQSGRHCRRHPPRPGPLVLHDL